MRLFTIATALLLPLLAVADDLSTTTLTATRTLTQTVTLKRIVATTTATWQNGTASYLPTGSGGIAIPTNSFKITATTTSTPVASASASASSKSSAAGSGPAAAMNVVWLGAAGAVAAVLL